MSRVIRALYRHMPFRQPVLTGLRSLWMPPQRWYRHLHFVGPFSVNIDTKHAFQINHYGYELENSLFWEGFDKGSETFVSLGIWSKLVTDADIVLDIGANTGVYSLVTKALNPSAKVVAVEPIPHVYLKSS